MPFSFCYDRSQYLASSWSDRTMNRCLEENRHSMKQLSFSEAIDAAAELAEQYLFNDFSLHRLSTEDSINWKKLRPEIRQYFETGNCGQVNSSAASVNPTFLQPTTSKWLLHHEACPFFGYFPLPIKELEVKTVKNGIIADFCKDELKKLLTAFRKRMNKIMFYFHPCDALAFCYGDLPYKFDIIDTSTLADTLGLANLLNAAGRRLLSDESMLITENTDWLKVAPTVSKYIQEMLFCPLSLIPTLYGFRLMDNVEWGQDKPHSICHMSTLPTQLRWKKTKPFDGVPLVLSPPLNKSLQRLMDACSINPCIASVYPAVRKEVCKFFSPLTFCYVLSDLIRRGGVPEPSALTGAFISTLRPVFRKSFETCRAWMENRPVWRVNVHISSQQIVFDHRTLLASPFLCLVLVPTSAVLHTSSFRDPSSAAADLTNQNSAVNHVIGNFEVNLKVKSSGQIEWNDITFILEDHSLLQSHSGVVIDSNGLPVIFIGPLSGRQCNSDLCTQTFPLTWENQTSCSPAAPSGSKKSQLIGESCQETEDIYTIRFKIVSGRGSKPPSGIKELSADLNAKTKL